VDDEHAAPRHALLTLLEDGRVRVRDLGTRNGTRVDGDKVPVAGAIIEQGEVLGRARAAAHPHCTFAARPERIFRGDFVRKYRTLLAAFGVSACIAYGSFLQWLSAPSSLFRSVTTAALVALGLIALWTGLWSLTTKLNHGSWHVRVHLAIASIGAAFCAWGYWVTGLVAFAAQRFVAGAGGQSPSWGRRHSSRCICTCARRPITGAAYRWRWPAPRLFDRRYRVEHRGRR
jgi:hypothetical protein